MGEARGQQPLPRPGDPSGPPAEIEEEIVERHARGEDRLLDRGPPLARGGLEPGGAHVRVDRGKPRPALRAVYRGGGLGVGPGETRGRIVPEPEAHDLREGEAPDSIGQVGRNRGARGGIRGGDARYRVGWRAPGHLRRGRGAPHSRDARRPRAPREEERRDGGGAPHRPDPVGARRRDGTPRHCTSARPIASAM